MPTGSNWQTPHDLHTRPEFAEFTQLVEIVGRSVAQFLQLEQYPMMITGCWANINPPGTYHPTHNHPNNYLSGVYYVDVSDGGPELISRIRGRSSIMPWSGKLNRSPPMPPPSRQSRAAW